MNANQSYLNESHLDGVAEVQQPQYPYNLKLESTATGIRIHLSIHGNDPEVVREEAIGLLVTTQQDLISKGFQIAPVKEAKTQ